MLTRVTLCRDILETLNKRSTFTNMVVIDEKQFYDRPIGNHLTRRKWIKPSGDIPQIPKRSSMDKKHMALVALSFTGLCHAKVLDRGETVDSNVYVNFLNEMLEKFDTFDLREQKRQSNLTTYC